MSHSPGHRKWPEHKVIEEHPNTHVEVFFNGEKIADSKNVIKVIEDEYPDRYYIPREDVRMSALQRSEEMTQCPFKGIANYYSVKVGDHKAENAVWTYEDPYDEHADLKDRLAFYGEKFPELKVQESRPL